eukprot:ANDGO_02088.mRNA.1 Ubiquitin-related modifier 1 homolog
MAVFVELAGGLETLFGKEKKLIVELSHMDVRSRTIRGLVTHLIAHHVRQKPDLFGSATGEVRPGILVLVNDVDWEILGGHDSPLEPSDTVVFISTLHGG